MKLLVLMGRMLIESRGGERREEGKGGWDINFQIDNR